MRRDAHLLRGQGVGKVLLIGKDEDANVAQLVVAHHVVEFGTSLCEAIGIVARVDHEDDRVCSVVVVLPQRPDPLLPANIPHAELDVPELDFLRVEANCRYGVDFCCGRTRWDVSEVIVPQSRARARTHAGNMASELSPVSLYLSL